MGLLAVGDPKSAAFSRRFLLPPLISSFTGERSARRSLWFQRRPTTLSLTVASLSSGGVGNGDSEPPVKSLRRLLDSPGVHLGPACFDALSAKLVEQAGFDFCFTSGFSVSAARLGLPDAGLISYGEMVDQGQKITEAVSIPVIGDGDNGYGNAMNVKRTVKGYIKAGLAGIILEDQVSPKACGHTRGRKVVSREEAVMRIKAAVHAREETGSDIVIVARTDSRQAASLDEALWRTQAFADAGADILFIDALASRKEMEEFCNSSPLVPKMGNMLEGGGKTPILNPMELEDVGYKIVAYPLSLIGVSIRAMQDALKAIKSGRLPPPGSIPSFEEIKDVLGFNIYYEEEKRYALGTSDPFAQTGRSDDTERMDNDGMDQGEPDPVVPVTEVIIPDVYSPSDADGLRGPLSGIWSRTLRIKITGGDGLEKLDVRIPAGFLDGVTNIVPGFSISGARLGLPDAGFISYGEMVDQGQKITEAVSIPVIGDADDGYGNAMNVKRTVKGYIKAGFAGIFIEDQVAPKACGHTRGRKVISREEALMKIKAAIDARAETGSDIVIIARTDSRQAVSLDEALWRTQAFADAGVDALFIDALASKEEMEAFCKTAPMVPKMANMLEGGGKTPILTPMELNDIGFKIVVYPLSLIGVSIKAMQDALNGLKSGKVPPPESIPSFEEIKEVLGFNAYYEEEKRYALSTSEK